MFGRGGVETMSIRIKSKVRFIISVTVFLLMIIVSFSFFLLKGKAQEAPTYYLDWYVTKAILYGLLQNNHCLKAEILESI